MALEGGIKGLEFTAKAATLEGFSAEVAWNQSIEIRPNVPLLKRACVQVKDPASLELLLFKSEMPFLSSEGPRCGRPIPQAHAYATLLSERK